MIVDSRSLWSSLKTHSVTVSVQRIVRPGYIFRVSRLIHMGARGRKMVFLSPYDENMNDVDTHTIEGSSLFSAAMQNKALQNHTMALSLPQRCKDFDFIYTGCNMTPIMDVHATIHNMHEKSTLGSITPEVVTPGDFLIFKPKACKTKVKLAEALRLIAH